MNSAHLPLARPLASGPLTPCLLGATALTLPFLVLGIPCAAFAAWQVRNHDEEGLERELVRRRPMNRARVGAWGCRSPLAVCRASSDPLA